MIDTLRTIGDIVQTNLWGRASFHPFIKTMDFNDPKVKALCYDINVNTKTKTISIQFNPVPRDTLKWLKYDPTNGNTDTYLVGPTLKKYVERKGKVCQYSKVGENMKALNITDQQLIRYGETLEANSEQINAFLKTLTEDYVINFTIDGMEFWEYENILDTIDKASIEEISVPSKTNPKYRELQNTLLGFFKTTKKNNTSQSPNLSIENSFKSLPVTVNDLQSLMYGKVFHETIKGGRVAGDIYLTYLPNIKGLPFNILKKITEPVYGPYDSLRESASKIKKIKKGASDLDEDESHGGQGEIKGESLLKRPIMLNLSILKEDLSIKKTDINFDIIFKLKGSQTVMDMSILSNYNITKIEQINERVAGAQNFVTSNKYRFNNSLIRALTSIFKMDKDNDTKKYDNFFADWVYQVFTDKYNHNSLLDQIMFEHIEYIIRNTSEEEKAKKAISSLFQNYNFLKLMETNGQEKLSESKNSLSYELGSALGELCTTHGNDRKNLKSFIQNFEGHMTYRIKRLRDVESFANEVVQRMIRNSVSNFEQAEGWYNVQARRFRESGEKFSSHDFKTGYFESKYSYSNYKLKQELSVGRSKNANVPTAL